MTDPLDTIAAPITGSQPAAVAIVRLSGPDAWSVASRVFRSWPADPLPKQAYYGHYATGDDGFVLLFEPGHSYTAEPVAELSCHGSRAAVRGLVDACILEGARMAEPGEFTLRAFMNGRMDLTAAEGVRDTVEALTETQLRLANSQREGSMRLEFSVLRQQAISLLAAVEASVDFEEEIGPIDRQAMEQDLSSLIARLETHLETAELGRIMRSGFRIAIVGPPNAGKSSLLNALIGTERSIVTELPGTTRDFVEEQLDFSGVPVVLIDTAGLRQAKDPVEAIGVQRSLSQAACADAVWFVYDAAKGFTAQDRNSLRQFAQPVTIVANKTDLAAAGVGHLGVSCKTRDGLDELVETVARKADEATAFGVPPINERHAFHLTAAKAALQSALGTLRNARPDDLLSVDLRAAADNLGMITGETATPDIIERIFHDFCIGK